jgi:hypothetical protein
VAVNHRNAVRLILGEVQREHGQSAANGLTREPGLEQAFDLADNTCFSSVGC